MPSVSTLRVILFCFIFIDFVEVPDSEINFTSHSPGSDGENSVVSAISRRTFPDGWDAIMAATLKGYWLTSSPVNYLIPCGLLSKKPFSASLRASQYELLSSLSSQHRGYASPLLETLLILSEIAVYCCRILVKTFPVVFLGHARFRVY